jgi:hypothetical protein
VVGFDFVWTLLLHPGAYVVLGKSRCGGTQRGLPYRRHCAL